MDGLSEEQIAEGNKINFEAARKEFKEFKSAYTEGHCYLCKLPLVSHVENRPCINWLLNMLILRDRQGSHIPAVVSNRRGCRLNHS